MNLFKRYAVELDGVRHEVDAMSEMGAVNVACRIKVKTGGKILQGEDGKWQVWKQVKPAGAVRYELKAVGPRVLVVGVV